ncbi:MAG: aldehyde ferredoxin oxidoreductase family protein [Candidatus Latescibacteria bacterium]|nr:aldehyde ferredoxin oxidoreductase family protein [Candidatus Latescibacterota bacterium]
MPYGYNGTILRVNLTTGAITTEEPGEAIYRRYLGGGGLGAYYLLKEVPAGIDPFGPENKLIFMTSVINGTPLSGVNRYAAVAKSPLTDGYGESEAGGYWGPALKAAGFDGIIVEGQAERPVYLYVNDGECEIRDASRYWGQLADAVQHGLEEEIGDKKIRVLQTGVAGENLVRFAAIVNQQRHFHGRAGLGAVMGSKRLKAIVCRGRKRMELADKEDMQRVLQWFKEAYDPDTDPRHDMGTAQAVRLLNADGILPTYNFRDGSFEQAMNISGQTMRDTILANRGTCYACVVACKREVEVEGTDVTPEYGGPEYETIAAHGSLLGIGNLNHIALVNKMLAQYVLDSISTGAVIGFAMECYERGIITREDTDGLELTFGNEEVALRLIDLIARREGIGAILADGVMRAAARFGQGAEHYALHVKGQEIPMHEPRGKRSLALAYATSPTGADHMEAPHDPFYESFNPAGHHALSALGLIEPVDRLDMGPKKVKAFYYTQLVWSLYDTVGMCDFVCAPINDLELDKLVDYVSAVTGWEVSLWELLKVSERGNAMKRAFNVREGFGPEDDTLPERLFEPLQSGALKGVAIDRDEFARMKRLYYDMVGWDRTTGFPTTAKLAELDLDWLEPDRPGNGE